MANRPERLVKRVNRRLMWIAAGVLIANIAFVAFYDASDQEALLADVVKREIINLDRAILQAPAIPPDIRTLTRPHYTEHPEAYGYILVDAEDRIVDSQNAQLIPPNLLGSPIAAGDWVTRQAQLSELETYASHVVIRPEGMYRVYFGIVDDPANLIRYEILDEFFGHVWLPLLPTVILLIGGALLILHRDLAPVAKAASWARQIRPGKPAEPFRHDDMPAEILDLTDAVNRAVDRLNSELESEKRRAAEAAHALRTPVAVLVARLDSLPKTPELKALRADIKSLSRTVTQFLLSSGADRMEVGEDEQVELNAVAEETIKSLTPFALMRGAEIVFSPNNAPQQIRGRTEGVELALTNLIENAVSHGAGGRIDVSVGPGPIVSVSDTGPGLPQSTENDIFKPFWRGTSAPKGGAGLGLAIVDRIQRAHGGRVSASNNQDGGATFTLYYQGR